MKGKRHTTEQKIRILREADGGKSERVPKTGPSGVLVFGLV